ncbi:MAG: hypothetical protein QOF63_1695 [Thermoanaerobaculia bacterium]|jgi:hypothetical protein|nr:hypothetical protein [Thermoanaerobaculia bacterium]MEA2416990.1 hypothetical protein [Thermoanaerobaculia bacterium]
MFSKDDERLYHSLVARAWTDKAFHKRFVEHPGDVLKENGVQLPDHVDVSVNEGESRGKLIIGLPHRPAHLSDDDIKKGGPEAQADPCIF